MQQDDETRRLVQTLLATQMFAVLSTGSEMGPWSSLISFWAAEDLGQVVFPTLRATRKFVYMASHPRVALLFDDRSNRAVDVTQATAVTATGVAREISDPAARTTAAAAFLAKHPQLDAFVASPDCALVRVDVDTYFVVTQFQKLTELRVRGPDRPE